MNTLILVANLPYSEPAIRFGGLVARLTRSPVTLLYAGPLRRGMSGAESVLTRAGEMLSGVTVSTRVRRGSLAKSTLAEIRAGEYDLVVLRARQSVNLGERLRGAVGRTVAAKSPISVLVVKRDQPDLDRVLICTGGQGTAEPVIQAGGRLAQAAQAQATVLHVASPIPRMFMGLDAMEETLPELLQTDTPLARHLRHAAETLAQYQVSAELKLRRGDVVDEILQETHNGNYDLVLIGASEVTKGLKEWLLGNVAQRIVDDIPCPVLVVR